jgi:hypothetical protein
MTEAEWLATSDVEDMWYQLQESARNRKLRHLMVEPTLRVVQRLAGKNWKYHSDLLERFAAGLLSRAQLSRKWRNLWWKCEAFQMFGFPWTNDERLTLIDNAQQAITWYFRLFLPPELSCLFTVPIWQAARESADGSPCRRAMKMLADDIRCIFGNPFRPVAFADSWRSETAVALATGIYEERAFDRLPILADALEEAGCDHADVLNHLRGPGPHARGCWVVDGVLRKV